MARTVKELHAMLVELLEKEEETGMASPARHMIHTFEFTLDRGTINQAQACNRASCLIALAINKSQDLQGHGYIRVDEKGIAFTKNQVRYTALNCAHIVQVAKDFDAACLNPNIGLQTARAWQPEMKFKLDFFGVPATPPADKERKAQINRNRNARNAALRAQGHPYTSAKMRFMVG